MKMSLIFVMTISDSSSPSLQFFASSESVSWNFSKNSCSFCLRPKNLNLSYFKFVVIVKVVFSNSQNSAKLISRIFFPGFLCEKFALTSESKINEIKNNNNQSYVIFKSFVFSKIALKKSKLRSTKNLQGKRIFNISSQRKILLTCQIGFLLKVKNLYLLFLFIFGFRKYILASTSVKY